MSEYLELQSIKYSQWPKDIKDDFKRLCKNTSHTLVKKYKEELNKIPEIQEIIDDLKKIKNDCNNSSQKLPVELNKKIDKSTNGIMATIGGFVFTAFNLAGGQNLEKCFDKKKIRVLAKELIKCNFCDNNLEEVIDMVTEKYMDCKKCCKNIISFAEDQGLDFDEDDIDSDSDLEYNLSDLLNNKQTIKVIFKNQFVCIALVAVSFANLYWSIKGFKNYYYEIEEKIGSYNSELKRIKKNFEEHTKELEIFDNENYNKFINNIKTVRDNIQQDQIKLEQLIKDIENEIEQASKKRNLEIAGVVGSIALTAITGVGSVVTGGLTSAAYGVSSLFNLVSGGLHTSNLIKLLKYISDLRKILKEANELDEQIKGCIDKLISKLNEKKLEYPDFHKEFIKIRTIQNMKKDINSNN